MTANIYNVMLPRLGVLVRAQVASLSLVGGAEVSPPGTEGAFFVTTLSFINSHSIELISVNPKRTIMSTPRNTSQYRVSLVETTADLNAIFFFSSRHKLLK